MKTSRILLFIAFLCSFQLVSAQFQKPEYLLEYYFIAEQAELLEITPAQLDQLKGLDSLLMKAWEARLDNDEVNDSDYLTLRTEELKKVLTDTQYEQLIVIAEESLEEERIAANESLLNQWNSENPGLDMTMDQVEHYISLIDSINNRQIVLEGHDFTDMKKSELVQMERVLSSQQFQLFEKNHKNRALNEVAALEETLRGELPIMKAFIGLYVDEFAPKLQVLRARFEKELSPSDQRKVKHYRLLLHEAIDAIIEEEVGRSMNTYQNITLHDEALKTEMEGAVQYAFEGLKKVPIIMDFVYSSFLDQEIIEEMVNMTEKYMPAMQKQEIGFKALFAELKEGHEKIEKEFQHSPYFKEVDIKAPTYRFVATDALKFLLTTPAEIEEEELNSKDVHLAKAFPSPAKTMQTLAFNLRQASPVQIEIIDQKGQVVQNVFSGTLGIGVHQLNVDVQRLNGTIFFYRITSSAGTSTLDIMIAK